MSGCRECCTQGCHGATTVTCLALAGQRPERFYEIEAIRNAWSVRELSRQTASLLYDRLAKSKYMKGLMRRATKGHEVVQPIDAWRCLCPC